MPELSEKAIVRVTQATGLNEGKLRSKLALRPTREVTPYYRGKLAKAKTLHEVQDIWIGMDTIDDSPEEVQCLWRMVEMAS